MKRVVASRTLCRPLIGNFFKNIVSDKSHLRLSSESKRKFVTMATSNGNSFTNPNYVEKKVFKDGELLDKVLELTRREKLMTKADESQKVVEFKHPSDLQKILPMQISKNGCANFEEIEDILEKVVKYSVKTTHPHFYNQLYGGVDEVGLSSAWMMEALNTNQHTFEVAPAFILIEHFLIQELCHLFGWQDGDGIFSPGGSISNMYGITLARYKKHPDIKETGLFACKEMVIFTSDMSHYSIQKAASFMGFGTNQVVKVASDENGRMIPTELKNSIHKIKQEGKEPFFVNATSGTTVYGAFDPLDEIAQVCEEEGLWLHVDACWGGGVILSEAYKHLLDGIQRADSIAWNPHKMICVPLQCSVFIVRHKGLLGECNSAGASYLFQQDKFYDISFDTGDKSIQCGRKVDAFKLWLTFKVHGLDVLRKRVDNAFAAAGHLEKEIDRREGFRRVLKERDCTNVCFWYIPPSLRNSEEISEWWQKLHKVAPVIKGRMVQKGTVLLGYQPMESKNLVNFFRMITTSHPVSTKEEMNFVLDEIENVGKDL